MRTVTPVYLLFSYGLLNIKDSHLSHLFMSTLFRERLMHLPFDFIFDRVMALARYKCSGGAWCSACSAFIYKTDNFCVSVFYRAAEVLSD